MFGLDLSGFAGSGSAPDVVAISDKPQSKLRRSDFMIVKVIIENGRLIDWLFFVCTRLWSAQGNCVLGEFIQFGAHFLDALPLGISKILFLRDVFGKVI